MPTPPTPRSFRPPPAPPPTRIADDPRIAREVARRFRKQRIRRLTGFIGTAAVALVFIALVLLWIFKGTLLRAVLR
jgi:uncharacterized membrane protein